MTTMDALWPAAVPFALGVVVGWVLLWIYAAALGLLAKGPRG